MSRADELLLFITKVEARVRELEAKVAKQEWELQQVDSFINGHEDDTGRAVSKPFATLSVDQAERIVLLIKDARDVNRQLWEKFPDADVCPIAHMDMHDVLAEITDRDLAALGDAEAAARLIVRTQEPLQQTKARGP